MQHNLVNLVRGETHKSVRFPRSEATRRHEASVATVIRAAALWIIFSKATFFWFNVVFYYNFMSLAIV